MINLTCKSKGRNCRCSITHELDKHLYGLTGLYFTYLSKNDVIENWRPFTIRIPGRSIGIIDLTDDGTITNIEIMEYAKDSFDTDMSSVLNQFIGQKMNRDIEYVD